MELLRSARVLRAGSLRVWAAGSAGLWREPWGPELCGTVRADGATEPALVIAIIYAILTVVATTAIITSCTFFTICTVDLTMIAGCYYCSYYH